MKMLHHQRFPFLLLHDLTVLVEIISDTEETLGPASVAIYAYQPNSLIDL